MNIAWHSGAGPEPENMFEGWMNSPPHRHNILEEDFRQIRIGTAAGSYKGYEDSVMYTAAFGVRRGRSPGARGSRRRSHLDTGGTHDSR